MMSTNSFYQIVPIKSEFLTRTRELGLDDQGQKVERLLANGGELCRDVLRAARAGEELILASYCPFDQAGPYKEFGPVFMLANPDDTQAFPTSFPVSAEREYFGKQFVLRAYSKTERIVDACLSTPEQFESDLQRFLANADVAFVLARFAAYGCYGCRIERAASDVE
jgi:hypothetical protein